MVYNKKKKIINLQKTGKDHINCVRSERRTTILSLTATIVASAAIILNVTKNIAKYLPVGEFKFFIVYLQFFVLVLSVVIVLFYCIRYI